MESATQFIFQIVILIFSVVIHEVSHGYAALMLGDRTAQQAGRLTLNPVFHIDLFGSILIPILTQGRFGWAKPVPFNPYNLRNQKWGPALVGAAGPGANLALALIFGLLARFLLGFADGASGAFISNFATIVGTVALLNLVLAFFNLVPIPPLDGSRVLFASLPYRWRRVEILLERYGFFIIIILVFPLGRWFLPIIFTPVLFSFRLITGTLPFL